MADAPTEAAVTGQRRVNTEELGVSAQALESLEKDFHDVMRELGAEDNLERFRLEYEKLHRALKKSHESEKRLIKKCQELNQEIMANAARVQSALKMSHEDQSTIESLRKEIEKAWKMVDNANEKETRAKETIQNLKKEVAHLSNLVEQGATLTSGQESNLQELLDQKKELMKEQATLGQKITQQTHEIREMVDRLRKIESGAGTREEELQRTLERLAQAKREYEQESRKRERNEMQIKELAGTALQARTNECELRKQTIKQKTELLEQLQGQLRDETVHTEQLAQKIQKNTKELESHAKALDDETALAQRLSADIAKLQSEIVMREAEINAVRHNETKLHKQKDQRDKYLKKVIQDRDEVLKEHEAMESQISALQKQVDAYDRERKDYVTKLDDIKEEIGYLVVKEAKQEEKKQLLVEAAQVEQVKRRELERQLDDTRKENLSQKLDISALEKAREKYAAMASEATAKNSKALEEVKIRAMRIEDLQKQLDESARQQKNQQGMYEQVRTDRNTYSKNLIEAQDEISEMKRKFRIMDHQIEQLKEELSLKEKKHVEAQANCKGQNEKLTKTRKLVNHYIAEFEQAREKSEGLTNNIKQLTQIISACDEERAQQQQMFATVTNERDILGTQLIRRNDELALLYEKIRIQQATLSKGEIQYRDRVTDIRMLRLKIHEIQRTLHMTQARVRNVDGLKKQIIVLQRQLIHERRKVKALSEELENPQNSGRWRALQGAPLKEHEMVQKIQSLQKRLISKTEEGVEKDIVIQEKEKLYIELKNILARQPGPEVSELLNIYHEHLRKRNQAMKVVASELNMSSTQQSEYKYEVERLNRELQEVKKRYFELKMKNGLLLRQKQQRDATMGYAGVGGAKGATTGAMRADGDVAASGGVLSIQANTVQQQGRAKKAPKASDPKPSTRPVLGDGAKAEEEQQAQPIVAEEGTADPGDAQPPATVEEEE